MNTSKRYIKVRKRVASDCRRQALITTYIYTLLNQETDFFIRSGLTREAKAAEALRLRLEGLERILEGKSFITQPEITMDACLDKVLGHLRIVNHKCILTSYPVATEVAVASEHFEMVDILGQDSELPAEVL